MARQVRQFNRGNPDASALGTEAQTELDRLLQRADQLATQQQEGIGAVRAAVAAKKRLRKEIHETPLRHLVRIARAASREDPELRARFRMPTGDLSYQDFLAAARALANDAETHHDLFVGFGMPATFPGDLRASLDALEQAINQVSAATSSRTGAVADLDAVTDEIMLVVQRIDALTRLRFKDQPELLRGWESARNVRWPHPAATEAEAPAAPPPAGEKPAA